MGLFGGRKRNSRNERREPQLFDRRNSRASGRFIAVRQGGGAHSSAGSLVLHSSPQSSVPSRLQLIFGYVWFSLNQKGVLQIPELQPGVMLLAADGTVLSEQGAFFGDQVRVSDFRIMCPMR